MKSEKTKRKIIQIATTAHHSNKILLTTPIALCNDGTVWEMSYREGWSRLEDIPQDVEAQAKDLCARE